MSVYLRDATVPRNSQVTDAVLDDLKGLANLQSLVLSQTQITDAGMEHLEGLTGLEELLLTGTQVPVSPSVNAAGPLVPALSPKYGPSSHVTPSGLSNRSGGVSLWSPPQTTPSQPYVSTTSVRQIPQAIALPVPAA